MEELEILKDELAKLMVQNKRLKDENESLRRRLASSKTAEGFREQAQLAIQRKKEEKVKALRQKISQIVSEQPDISTKKLIESLKISNKTYYNLNLHDYFNYGEGI